MGCLWLALACGLIIDLLAAQTRLGLYSLNYCAVTWILFNQKKHFFEDSFSTFPIMTFLFSVISTLFHALLLYISSHSIEFSWGWIKSDLIFMPLTDALYAALAFTIPYHLLPKKYFRKRKATVLW